VEVVPVVSWYSGFMLKISLPVGVGSVGRVCIFFSFFSDLPIIAGL